MILIRNLSYRIDLADEVIFFEGRSITNTDVQLAVNFAEISPEELGNWLQHKANSPTEPLIQVAFPNARSHTREFFMTGQTDSEWDDLMDPSLDILTGEPEVEEAIAQAEDIEYSNAPYCGCCKCPCSPRATDVGIGPFEFWGQRGVDTRIEYVSDCCEWDMFSNRSCTKPFNYDPAEYEYERDE